MRYDPATDTVHLCKEAEEEGERDFDSEDLDHIRDAALEIQDKSKATSLPGLECVYYQIQLRLAKQRTTG